MDQTVHFLVAFLITGLNVSQNATVMNNSVIISLDAEVQIFHLVYLFSLPILFYIYVWIVANSKQFENYIVHAYDFFFNDINTVISLFQKRKSHRMLAFFTMSTNF